jgi:undecaprenyl-diphosphatase
LLLALALPLSFFLAQVIQKHVDRPRPLFSVDLEIPIDPVAWQNIKSTFSLHGSFPSNHAIMFTVVITGILSIHMWAGLLAVAIGLYYSALRVGVGFHWPSDVMAGAFLGAAVTVFLLFIKSYLLKILDFVLQFERCPVITYPMGFLMLLDLSQKLSTLFYLVSLVLGAISLHTDSMSRAHR